MSDSPLPLDEVPTPALDAWEHHAGGWDYWLTGMHEFRVQVEMVDLDVPPSDVLTAFEIRLDDCRGGRPFETVLRETVRNSRLAVCIAEELASSPTTWADNWNEGLAPRPEDVGELPDR